MKYTTRTQFILVDINQWTVWSKKFFLDIFKIIWHEDRKTCPLFKRKETEENDPDIVKQLQLNNKEFKAAIVIMLKDMKGNTLVLNEMTRNFNKETITKT